MKLFGEYLVEKKIVTAEQLVKALIRQSATLPSVAEIAFKKNLISSEKILEIFRQQHEKKTGFIEAAKELNLWNDGLHLETENHIASLRAPLGQILVEMAAMPIEAITHALDDFLANMDEPSPPPKPTVDYSNFCDSLNSERKESLMGSFSLMKLGDISPTPIMTAKESFSIMKQAAQISGVIQSELLIQNMETLMEMIMKAEVGKINGDMISKIGEVCEKAVLFLSDLIVRMNQGIMEDTLLNDSVFKESFESISAALEMTRFDLDLL